MSSGLRASGVAALVASDEDGYLSEEIPVISQPRRIVLPRARGPTLLTSESAEEVDPRIRGATSSVQKRHGKSSKSGNPKKRRRVSRISTAAALSPKLFDLEEESDGHESPPGRNDTPRGSLRDNEPRSSSSKNSLLARRSGTSSPPGIGGSDTPSSSRNSQPTGREESLSTPRNASTRN